MHRRYALLPVLAELGIHGSASLEAQIVERAHWPVRTSETCCPAALFSVTMSSVDLDL